MLLPTISVPPEGGKVTFIKCLEDKKCLQEPNSYERTWDVFLQHSFLALIFYLEDIH